MTSKKLGEIAGVPITTVNWATRTIAGYGDFKISEIPQALQIARRCKLGYLLPNVLEIEANVEFGPEIRQAAAGTVRSLAIQCL